MEPSKYKIPAKEILADIRGVLTSRQLRDKYRLSKKVFGALSADW
jgi:hypothetical protein